MKNKLYLLLLICTFPLTATAEPVDSLLNLFYRQHGAAHITTANNIMNTVLNDFRKLSKK